MSMGSVVANEGLGGLIKSAIKKAGGGIKNGFMEKGLYGIKNDVAVAEHITGAGNAFKGVGKSGQDANLAKKVMGKMDSDAAAHLKEQADIIGPKMNMEQARERLGMTQDYADASNAYQKHVGEQFDGVVNGVKESAGAAFRYFIPKDPSVKSISRAAVRYGTAAVGLRYLSGGNLTTNARGEKDIAGIPFI